MAPSKLSLLHAGALAAGLILAGGVGAHFLGASHAGAAQPAAARAIEMPDPMSPPGGDYTTALQNRMAFAQSGPKLTTAERRDFFFGNRLFNTNWTAAPGSVEAFDGLGPTFNRVSCSGCHTRDGRGHPPLEAGEPFDSMLLRLSLPGKAEDGGPKPHPAYGDQFNDRAVLGVPAEGKVELRWEIVKGHYGDGTPYELQRPIFFFTDLAFGPLGDDIMTSPRVAPAVIGLGLLEFVPEKDILALADPEDADGDGISGRPNWVHDPETAEKRLGRFGWKANQPSLLAQDAGAANGDIGLTTSVHPQQNCPPAQTACRAAPDGGSPEISDEFLAKLVHYNRTLAVPARRAPADPEVVAGSRLFAETGCAACHTPTLRTGPAATPISLANQTFHPYTDLLLHDMGPELADGRPDFEASGSEWRTPPLWGIGLVPAVNGHDRLLHDGRARGVAEAILWHGGEAEAARERFKALNSADRERLVAFVKSL